MVAWVQRNWTVTLSNQCWPGYFFYQDGSNNHFNNSWECQGVQDCLRRNTRYRGQESRWDVGCIRCTSDKWGAIFRV